MSFHNVMIKHGQPKTVCENNLSCDYCSCLLVNWRLSLPRFRRKTNLRRVLVVVIQLGNVRGSIAERVVLTFSVVAYLAMINVWVNDDL